MADLLREFFKRDLSNAEEEKLAQQLASSPRHSMRFAKLARLAYVQTGLPNPSPHLGHAAASHLLGPMALKIVGGLLAGSVIAVVVWKAHQAPVELKPSQAPVPALTTTPPPRPPTPVISHPNTLPLKTLSPAPLTLPQGMVQPLAYDPNKKYEGLDLVVERPSTGLVTVRILDASNKEVRLLFAGMLDKGKWDFQWDGKQQDGSMAEPGIYRVEVQSNGRILDKEIKLQGETGGGDKK
jgi:hypothetical protein